MRRNRDQDQLLSDRDRDKDRDQTTTTLVCNGWTTVYIHINTSYRVLCGVNIKHYKKLIRR